MFHRLAWLSKLQVPYPEIFIPEFCKSYGSPRRFTKSHSMTVAVAFQQKTTKEDERTPYREISSCMSCLFFLYDCTYNSLSLGIKQRDR